MFPRSPPSSKKISTTERSLLFRTIEQAIDGQLNRLFHNKGDWWAFGGRHKAQKIKAALERLREAVIYRNELEGKSTYRHTQTPFQRVNIERTTVLEMDLSSEKAMLDVSISEWENKIEIWNAVDSVNSEDPRIGYKKQLSLRQTLNISRDNIFNSPHSTWRPLWGKTRALKQIETEINHNSLHLRG